MVMGLSIFRPLRVLLALSALVLLTCYLFDGLSLARRAPEPLPWSEFVVNDRAVQHFRQTAELSGHPIGPTEAELKKAYEAVYIAQVRAYQGSDAPRARATETALKRSWRAVYRLCYPALRATRQGQIRAVPEFAQERVGMFITLFLLALAFAGVQAWLRRVERQAGV